MAGKIIADTIEASGSQISLNVGNVTVLTASSTGLTLIPTTNVNVNLTNSIVTLTNGSATSPGLTFSGNTRTGLFMPSANTLAFTAANTESMRIDSSGNVGIGTNSPGVRLQIGNPSDSNQALRFDFPDSSTSRINSTRVSSGNLQSLLLAGQDTMQFQTNGTERMRITSAGLVGIGQSSPASMLDVYGSTNATAAYTAGTSMPYLLRLFNSGSGVTGLTTGIQLQTRSGDQSGALWNIGAVAHSGGSYSNLVFQQQIASAYTEAARFDISGNFLVGNTTQVSGERFSVGSGSNVLAAWIQQNTNTSGYNVMVLGLGSNGNNTSSSFIRGNTNAVGNWYLYGNGTTSFTSDQRLKKNIESTRNGYLEDLAQLRVVKYNWLKDNDGTPKELGLIAQEVEQVFPGLVQDDTSRVSEDDETVYKTLKQSVLPFMLLKAIQELKAIVDAQAVEIAALKAK